MGDKEGGGGGGKTFIPQVLVRERDNEATWRGCPISPSSFFVELKNVCKRCAAPFVYKFVFGISSAHDRWAWEMHQSRRTDYLGRSPQGGNAELELTFERGVRMGLVAMDDALL